MALVVGSSGGVGGRGGVRLILSAFVQRVLGLRSGRLGTGTRSVSYTSDEDDDIKPLVESIPRDSISRSTSRSLYGRDSESARMLGANHLPFGHTDWPAHTMFDVGTGWPESAKGGLEMTIGTRRVTPLPRERVPGQPPVLVVGSAPGQPPMLHIPLTDRLVASFLAQGVGVQTDRTDGVITAANRELIGSASSDSKGGPTQWMKVFRGLLLAHVFFTLPLIVIFFPRYEKAPENGFLLSLFDRKAEDTEKLIVLGLFVLHASLGSLGVVLAHIADGPGCTGIVGTLTLCITISVLGFIDYIFSKTLPPDTTYNVVFGVHFAVMLLVICGLWAKFVGFAPCCCSKREKLHVRSEEKLGGSLSSLLSTVRNQ